MLFTSAGINQLLVAKKNQAKMKLLSTDRLIYKSKIKKLETYFYWELTYSIHIFGINISSTRN